LTIRLVLRRGLTFLAEATNNRLTHAAGGGANLHLCAAPFI